jgi:hypothetical protein
MAKRTTKKESSPSNSFPWAKIAGGIAASVVASGFLRRLPFGRVLVAAAPIIIAGLQKKERGRRD